MLGLNASAGEGNTSAAQKEFVSRGMGSLLFLTKGYIRFRKNSGFRMCVRCQICWALVLGSQKMATTKEAWIITFFVPDL